jgi:hypothetical protein
MKLLIALLLVSAALITSGCYGSSDGVGSSSKRVTSEKPLAGTAEVARSFGNRVPANEDMVSLLKLPTETDGKYYAWQLGVSPKDNDVRVIYAADKDDTVILMRVDTRPEKFERYSHLTSTRGELRSTVYTSYGSREQRVIAPEDPTYQKALDDFKAQVTFWTGREQQIKAKFPNGAPRQALGELLELR